MLVKRKIKEWLKRYLPPEIVGTITAIAAATLAHHFTSNRITIAYVATLGESIGFFATVFIVYNWSLVNQRKELKWSKGPVELLAEHLRSFL